MADHPPIDTVRTRYPLTPEEHAEALQGQAALLARLRATVRTDELQDVEIATTFDPRAGGCDD